MNCTQLYFALVLVMFAGHSYGKLEFIAKIKNLILDLGGLIFLIYISKTNRLFYLRSSYL